MQTFGFRRCFWEDFLFASCFLIQTDLCCVYLTGWTRCLLYWWLHLCWLYFSDTCIVDMSCCWNGSLTSVGNILMPGLGLFLSALSAPLFPDFNLIIHPWFWFGSVHILFSSTDVFYDVLHYGFHIWTHILCILFWCVVFTLNLSQLLHCKQSCNTDLQPLDMAYKTCFIPSAMVAERVV